MTRIVYLHGFASSPHSSKAQFFLRKFAALGVPMEIPILDEGRFEELTISGQLAVIERAVGDQPAILIGSSLGGYLAALYANRHPAQVEKLVLLAPAFQFPRRWRERYSTGRLGAVEARRLRPRFPLRRGPGTAAGISVHGRRCPI